MKDSLELYKAVLKELDKFEAPSFTIKDFNYFFNTAKDNVVDEMAAKMETDEEAYFHVEPLLKKVPLSATADYDFTMVADVNRVCSYIVKCQGFKEDTARVLVPGRRGAILSNYYTKPSGDLVYYEASAGTVTFHTGDTPIENAWALVVENAPAIVVDRDATLRKDSILHSKTNRIIVREATRLFLENTQNARYQTQLIENKIKESK